MATYTFDIYNAAEMDDLATNYGDITGGSNNNKVFVIKDSESLGNDLNNSNSETVTLKIVRGGTLTITDNITINCDIIVEEGGVISVNSTKTLSINGTFEAGIYEVFTGSGTMAGSPVFKEAYPQWFGAKGDGSNDDTSEIQAAVDFTPDFGTVFFPNGEYKISSTITCSQKHIIGADPYETKFSIPSGTNITAFQISGSRLTVKNLNIWFNGTSQTSAAVGISFASSTEQFSRNIVENLFVRLAYTCFELKSSYKGMWMNTFINCHAEFFKKNGFYFDSIASSTTQTFISCYSLRDINTTETATKAMYFNNITELIFINCGIDCAEDVGLWVHTAYTVSINGMSFESCTLKTAGYGLIFSNASTFITSVNFKYTYIDDDNLTGDAFFVLLGAGLGSADIGEIFEAGTIGSKYKKLKIGQPNRINLLGSALTKNDIYDNGYNLYVNFSNRNRIYNNAAPGSTGVSSTFYKGDPVWNSAPTAGGTIGWVCTSEGTSGSLNGGSTTGIIQSGKTALIPSSLTGLNKEIYLSIVDLNTTKRKVNFSPVFLASTTVSDVQASSGQKNVIVASYANFTASDPVVLDQGNANEENNFVHSKKELQKLALTSVSGTFQAGETVTGGTSGATGIVFTVDSNDLYVSDISGTFQTSETVTGGTSSATGTIDSISSTKYGLVLASNLSNSHNTSVTVETCVILSAAANATVSGNAVSYDTPTFKTFGSISS